MPGLKYALHWSAGTKDTSLLTQAGFMSSIWSAKCLPGVTHSSPAKCICAYAAFESIIAQGGGRGERTLCVFVNTGGLYSATVLHCFSTGNNEFVCVLASALHCCGGMHSVKVDQLGCGCSMSCEVHTPLLQRNSPAKQQ